LAIFFHSLPCCLSPSRNSRCSSLVHRPGDEERGERTVGWGGHDGDEKNGEVVVGKRRRRRARGRGGRRGGGVVSWGISRRVARKKVGVGGHRRTHREGEQKCGEATRTV
jgi:hypothetical protein